MRRVVGIDPGCSGAIVLLAGDRDLVPVEWMRAPLVRLGKSSRLDSAALARFLGHHDVQHAYIEQVHSMPGQGVASSFGFGHAAGVVEGVVAALMPDHAGDTAGMEEARRADRRGEGCGQVARCAALAGMGRAGEEGGGAGAG